MKFGEKVRELRKKCGMTQAELAKKAGLGLKTITNYESGSTYPQNREVYATLAEILGCEADYLRIWQYIDTNPAKWREDCYYIP